MTYSELVRQAREEQEACIEYTLFNPKPADPSLTPHDYSTWGFYCDTCDVFIDLVGEGKVTPTEVGSVYGHTMCNTDNTRYIGYVHE